MRITHSLWTKPMLHNRWFVENQLEPSIWLYALSFLYAKEVADKVILHADDLGMKYLDAIPYDEVYPTLNQISDVHQKWWAMGKVIALENEPINSVHIDGDVFLRNPKLIREKFMMQGFDMVCQMVERGHLFSGGYEPQLDYFDHALRNVEVRGYGWCDYALNCGVLGFRKKSLKNEFIKNVKVMIAESSKDHSIMFLLDGQYEPNIIVEQYMLAGLAELTRSKIQFILDPVEVDQQQSLNQVANELGYIHAWGKTKYQKHIVEIVKEIVKKKSPETYRNIEEKFKNIEKETETVTI